MKLRSGRTYDPLYTGDKAWLPTYNEQEHAYTGPYAWLPHGDGVLRTSTGNVVEGYFYWGELREGTCKFPDGALYEGFFFKNKFMDHGTLVLPNGTRIEGDWVNGRLHGDGKVTEITGMSREGVPVFTTTKGWWWHGKYYESKKIWEVVHFNAILLRFLDDEYQRPISPSYKPPENRSSTPTTPP